MENLLSTDEMKKITGYDQPTKQCQILEDHGVFFVKDRNGFPRTTWYHFNHPSHLRFSEKNASNEEPDFNALDAL